MVRGIAGVLFFGLSLLGACGQPGRDSRSQLKIVGGAPAEARSFHAVALFRPDSSGVSYAFCSGVLLSPRHVLTAAHCSLSQQQLPYDTAELYAVVGRSQPEQGDQGPAKLAVKSLTVHPSFNAEAMGRDSDGVLALKDAHDLAVWELVTPAIDVAPAAILATAASELWLSQTQVLTIAGFGQSTAWESPWTAHEFRVAETGFATQYRQTKTETVPQGGRLIKKHSQLTLAAVSAGEFYAGGSGQPDTCKGDSGGPVFAKGPAGELSLLGLTSRGSSICETGGVYTRVGAYLPWLTAVISTGLNIR